MGTREHRADAPKTVRIAVISVSTTRSLAEDKSGHWIGRQALKEGHRVVSHVVVPDDVAAIRAAVGEARQRHDAQAVLVTGGTGNSVVFCMPGSLKACKLACRELIFPELGHLIRHLTKG